MKQPVLCGISLKKLGIFRMASLWSVAFPSGWVDVFWAASLCSVAFPRGVWAFSGRHLGALWHTFLSGPVDDPGTILGGHRGAAKTLEGPSLAALNASKASRTSGPLQRRDFGATAFW